MNAAGEKILPALRMKENHGVQTSVLLNCKTGSLVRAKWNPKNKKLMLTKCTGVISPQSTS